MKIHWTQTALLFLLVGVAPSCVSDPALGSRGDSRPAFLIVGPDRGFQGNREIKEACNAFAKDAASNGGRALVVAARVAGAGPYQRFLNGLRYRFNGKGIAPHPNLTRWMDKEIERWIAGLSPSEASPGAPEAE